MSEVEASATADLVAALGELTELTRDKTAKVDTKGGGSYSYTYTDLAGALGTVRPVLAAHRLGLIQPVRSWEGMVAVSTELVHASGERFASPELTMRQPDTAQALGSAITYLRRYSLLAALGLATEDDDGQAASSTSSSPRRRKEVSESPTPAPLSESMMEQFGTACATEGLDTATVLGRAYPKGIPDPLTERHLPRLRDTFKAMVAERGGQPDAAAGAGEGADDSVRPASHGQVGLIKAGYERMGYDRDAQLATSSSVIGRDITTHNELTTDEAGKLIDYLDSLEE